MFQLSYYIVTAKSGFTINYGRNLPVCVTQVDFKALVKDMMDSDIALMKKNERA